MKLTPERLQRMAEQVSPGPKAGGGLKLARSIWETPSVVVSPGPKAGGGLKLTKYSLTLIDRGFPRPQSRGRIETC